MSDEMFNFDKDEEMNKRKENANQFYNNILNHDEIPFFVGDNATIYDFYNGEKRELISRIFKYYGVNIKEAQLIKMKFWELLDYLHEHRYENLIE